MGTSSVGMDDLVVRLKRLDMLEVLLLLLFLVKMEGGVGRFIGDSLITIVVDDGDMTCCIDNEVSSMIVIFVAWS